MPPTMPASRSRAERFDEVILDAVAALERRWRNELRGVEFGVEDVPPSEPAPWEFGGVPLGRYFPADGPAGLGHRIVLYRLPIVARAEDEAELVALVGEVVVEQVAHMLGRSPDEIDPRA